MEAENTPIRAQFQCIVGGNMPVYALSVHK
jgi:hypothetical protein